MFYANNSKIWNSKAHIANAIMITKIPDAFNYKCSIYYHSIVSLDHFSVHKISEMKN